MATELKSAFGTYLRSLSTNQIHPVKDKVRLTRTVAERSECTSQFSLLVEQTRAIFAKSPHREDDESWRSSVQHVLRRARIYADALDGAIPTEKLFQRYDAAFTPREIVTTVLAPLEFVQFSSDDCFDFGTFRVCRFSEQELGTITESDTRDIFYPDLTLDVRLLSRYWWLVVQETSDPEYAGQHLSKRIDFQDQPVERRYGKFPSSVWRALEPLVLYDWNSDRIFDAVQEDTGRYLSKDQDGWSRFTLPFLLRSGGSLYGPPARTPDFSSLEIEPVFDRNGVEVGQRPTCDIYPCATSFSRSIAEYQGQLSAIRSRIAQTTEWEFIDVALSYLIKAFFADGLDQLLWHIAAIEALLGENQGRLTETLARRCGLILGPSNEDRRRVHKSFKKLYDLRCDLVHGKTKQGNAQEGHLAIARNLARDLIVWFLQYLGFLAEDLPTGDHHQPKRAELLDALETKEDSRKRISYLLNCVPSSFPNKRCWDGRNP